MKTKWRKFSTWRRSWIKVWALAMLILFIATYLFTQDFRIAVGVTLNLIVISPIILIVVLLISIMVMKDRSTQE